MTSDLIREFASNLVLGQRLLGLDIGSRKIGVALSDTMRFIATPYNTLIRQSFAKDTSAIFAIMEEHHVCGLVIGLPVTMMGQEGDSSRMVREFADKIHKKHPGPIYFQDERFSTAAVNRVLGNTQLTRKKKATLDDKMAASYILQGVLDQLRTINSLNS